MTPHTLDKHIRMCINDCEEQIEWIGRYRTEEDDLKIISDKLTCLYEVVKNHFVWVDPEVLSKNKKICELRSFVNWEYDPEVYRDVVEMCDDFQNRKAILNKLVLPNDALEAMFK